MLSKYILTSKHLTEHWLIHNLKMEIVRNNCKPTRHPCPPSKPSKNQINQRSSQDFTVKGGVAAESHSLGGELAGIGYLRPKSVQL